MLRSLETITDEIFAAITTKIQAFFPGYSPDQTEKSIENALSESHAIELWNAGLLNENIRRQDNPLQADSVSDQPYGTLEQWGIAKLGRGPYVTGRGEYDIIIVGTGGVVEAGTIYTNPKTGFEYTLKDRVVVNPGFQTDKTTYSTTTTYGGIGVRYTSGGVIGTISGTVIANTPGIAAALRISDVLTVAQIQPGVENPVEVGAIVVNPTDSETITEYREDTLRGYRVPMRGGARGDYVLWSDDVPGVKRAYHYAGGKNDLMGEGWLVIESDDETGLASVELLELVRNKIDSELDVTAPGLTIESIVNNDKTIFVEGFYGVVDSDLNSAKASVESAIDNYFDSVRPFVDGVDRSTARNDILKRVELTNVIIDAVRVYGGVISDAYWNPAERIEKIARNEKFNMIGLVLL